MCIPGKNRHTLLVVPFEQSKEMNPLISRLIWKLIEGVVAITHDWKQHRRTKKWQEEMAKYPDYLLKDLGLSPEEINQVRTYSIQMKSEQITHSVRRR